MSDTTPEPTPEQMNAAAAHTPELSTEQLAFCLRTLAKAKKAGATLRHLDTAFGHSVTWQLASGQTVAGSIQRTKGFALFNACKALLPHIYEHV